MEKIQNQGHPDGSVQQVASQTERRTINVEDTAVALGVSRVSLYRSIQDGSCPLTPIKIGRRIVFAVAELNRLLGESAA